MLGLWLGSAALSSGPALAMSATPAGFELTRSVQQSLARIQELWLQWVTASLQDNRARSDELLRELLGTVREIGFSHLPDLALGAAAQARQSAREENFERARRQLDAADAFDPGRPEVAFAEGAVARAEGNWLGAALATGRGFALTRRAGESQVAWVSSLLWLGLVFEVTAALFVALLAIVHGPAIVRGLRDRMSPPLPAWAAGAVILFLLLAPMALPSGLFVVLLLWSGLSWSFVTKSERIVLAGGWLLALTLPLAAARAQRDLALSQSPPMRAIAAFEEGRLYGGFFADLQVVRSALPDRPIALELAADVHRTLGQWDLGRSLYRRVLVDEPESVAVLINLGAYHFRKGEYALANAHFERATHAAQPSAAAWYNLSLGYSESLLFDESRGALEGARAIDSAAVGQWIATDNPDRVLTFNGSLAREEELREALLQVWGLTEIEQRGSRVRLVLGLSASAGVPLLGLAFGAWSRRRIAQRSQLALRISSPKLAHWLRTLLPALPAAEDGAGFWAWSNLLLLVALLLLPRAFELAGDLPLVGWPGPGVLTIAASVGLLIYIVLRIRAGTAESEE